MTVMSYIKLSAGSESAYFSIGENHRANEKGNGK